MAYRTIEKAFPISGSQDIGKAMKQKSLARFLRFMSDNRKSKIENLKLVGVFALFRRTGKAPAERGEKIADGSDKAHARAA